MVATANQEDINKLAAEQITAVWSGEDVDALDDLLAENVVAHIPGLEPVRGREAYKEAVQTYRAAFPDFRVEVHDLVATDNRTIVHYTVRGINDGELMGIEPTGRPIEVQGISLFRLEDGEAVEETNIGDMLGLFQQLGVVELPEA